MARPKKWRKIDHIPTVSFFSPSENEDIGLPCNILKLEELEAVRLKDLEGLEQEECASKMEVSRPTFQRILISAREKIADSLINGKSIKVEGGNFTRNICSVHCSDCNKEWNESFENTQKIKNKEYICPSCGSQNVYCQKSCEMKFCKKHCCRNRIDEE